MISFIANHWRLLAGGGAFFGIAIAILTVLGPGAILGVLKVIPRWCWEVIIAGLLLLAYGVHERGAGEAEIQAKWNAFNVAQALANKEAIIKRTEENTQQAKIQIATSNNIQKVHDNEIATLNTALAKSQRLRVGATFCGGAAGQANPQSASSSDGADPAGRLLSPEVDAAVKQLIMESEEVAATGRAAQAFIRENGMASEN